MATVKTGNLLDGAARTATVASRDVRNHYHRGVRVVIDVTAVSGTGPTMTVTLQGKNSLPGSSDYYALLASAAITTVGETVLTVYPGTTAAANSVANLPLPSIFRANCVIGGTTPSLTFSVRYELLP